MQKLMFHVQPAKITLKTLDRLCARLRDTSGGRMLDVLYGKYFFIRFLFISLTLLSIFFKVVCLNREMIRLVSFTRFYSRLLPSHSSRCYSYGCSRESFTIPTMSLWYKRTNPYRKKHLSVISTHNTGKKGIHYALFISPRF